MTDSQELLTRLYHSLRTPRRRYAIQILEDRENSTITTRTLAKNIASIEQEASKQQVSGEPYRNVYNALSQTHLPTLAGARIIIYDPQRQTVSPGPNFDIAALLIDINTPTVELFSASAQDDSARDSERPDNDS